jgi:hypothetical protein
MFRFRRAVVILHARTVLAVKGSLASLASLTLALACSAPLAGIRLMRRAAPAVTVPKAPTIVNVGSRSWNDEQPGDYSPSFPALFSRHRFPSRI